SEVAVISQKSGLYCAMAYKSFYTNYIDNPDPRDALSQAGFPVPWQTPFRGPGRRKRGYVAFGFGDVACSYLLVVVDVAVRRRPAGRPSPKDKSATGAARLYGPVA